MYTVYNHTPHDYSTIFQSARVSGVTDGYGGSVPHPWQLLGTPLDINVLTLLNINVFSVSVTQCREQFKEDKKTWQCSRVPYVNAALSTVCTTTLIKHFELYYDTNLYSA